MLGCNDYEVVDLGVMVPAARILEKAIEIDADLIGLSGLITPSLDEMTHVASEMERQGFTIPLLIGGATTSRTHTAVKIAPAYSGPVVHVIDASRAVGVAGALVQPDRRDAFVAGIRDEYETVRRDRAGQRAKEKRLTVAEARANHVPIDWSAVDPAAARPSSDRGRSRDYPLAELVDFIDWTPFFTTWEMRGAYPAILDDPRLGPAARDLHRDALALLDRLVARRAADGQCGRRLLAGQQRRRRHHRLVRRRAPGSAGGLPDPPPADGQARRPAERRPRRLRRPRRDRASPTSSAPSRSRRGSASTRSSPSSRPPTTTTRRSSPRPSPTGWPRPSPSGSTSGSAASCGATRPTRRSSNTDLIAERYQGIRPAPGYPACPDHTEKGTLFDLLEAESRAGIRLTESFAMWPGAAVSGYYLWNPASHYFGVGRIGRDQLADYAARKGIPLDEADRWLAPNLADDAGAEAAVPATVAD